MKNIWPSVLIVSLFAFIQACQGEDSDSSLKINNGIKVKPKAFNAVISQDGCTGTFVSPTTILTAAHCADHGFTYKGVKTKSFKSMGEHLGKPWGFDIDVRVLVFPQAVSDVWIPVKNKPLKVGDKVVIAGYGVYDNTAGKGDGQFRFGTNIIKGFEADGNLTQIFGSQVETEAGKEGLNSSTGAGDSGGPMLHEGQLTAVTSGGAGDKSIHVNLTDPEIRAFLDAMVREGADIKFDGKGTVDYEECFDVVSEKDAQTFVFQQPHSKVSSVTGKWSTCVCDDCPETDQIGYSAGTYKDYRPVYKDVNAGALLLWSKRTGKATDMTFDKAGVMKDKTFEFKAPIFGAKMSMHAKAESKKKGKLKVCFL